MSASEDDRHPPGPGADIAWVVALLPGPQGRPRVLHPQGVSPLPEASRTVMLCGTHRLNDVDVSWAFGYVPPDALTPEVTFVSRHGWRARPGAVRRLTATTWAAQLTGRWPRIRVG